MKKNICDLKFDCPGGNDEFCGENVNFKPYKEICDSLISRYLRKETNSSEILPKLDYTTTGKSKYLLHYPFKFFKNAKNSINCLPNEYSCRFTKICIRIDNICDSILHCYYGDDEYECG